MILKLVYIFVFFHNIYFANSQDIELEGVFRFGESFLNQLRSDFGPIERSKDDSSLKTAFSSKLSENTDSSEEIGSDIDIKVNKTMPTEGDNNGVISLKKEPIGKSVKETANENYHDQDKYKEENVGKSKHLMVLVDNNEDLLPKQSINNYNNSAVKTTNENNTSKTRVKNTENIFQKDTSLSKDDPRIKYFLHHMIFNVGKDIGKIAEKYQKTFSLDDPEYRSLLKTVCEGYMNKMKRYITFIHNTQEPTSYIDKEYLYLDVIASSNMLLHSEVKKLLKTMLEKTSKNITERELQTLKRQLYKDIVSHKKNEINFICTEIKICRAYPGFSDYFSEFLNVLLNLSDDRLTHVVKIISSLIRNRSHFFKSFMKESVADTIGEKLETFSTDLQKLRELFSVVRSIINHKFKLMKTLDQELRNKTKAVRLLLDIIDKTFSLTRGDHLTVLTIDTAVTAIRIWALGKRDKVDMPLRLFLEHIVSVLRFNWDKEVRDEVVMLTEYIMTGKTDSTVIFNNLFERGSLFVKYDRVFTP